MGYGFFEPGIVYGFYEENQTKLLCQEFLEKYDLEKYALYTNKGECFGIIYGKSCKSIEDMNTIDKIKVDKVFDIVSKKGKFVYDAPKIMLALSGHINTSGYDKYDPESDS